MTPENFDFINFLNMSKTTLYKIMGLIVQGKKTDAIELCKVSVRTIEKLEKREC